MWAIGLAWDTCFLGVFRDGAQSVCALGFGRWGKVLGLFRIFSCLDFIFCLLISFDLETIRCLLCLPAQTWLIPSLMMRECG